MNTAIQAQFGIQSTGYELFDGEASPTITIDTDHHTFYVQTTDGLYKPSLGCLILAEGVADEVCFDDEHIIEAYADSTEQVRDCVIELAEQAAAQYFKDTKIEQILASDRADKIQVNASKIAAILGGEPNNYLILANGYEQAEHISINDAMISLQIAYGCSQQQSHDIIQLFL